MESFVVGGGEFIAGSVLDEAELLMVEDDDRRGTFWPAHGRG
ncbi:hypothetical protein [Streptomyces chartreusis]